MCAVRGRCPAARAASSFSIPKTKKMKKMKICSLFLFFQIQVVWKDSHRKGSKALRQSATNLWSDCLFLIILPTEICMCLTVLIFLKLFYMCGNDDQVFTSSWWSIWEQLAGTGVCGARATCKWLYPPWWNVSVAALLSVVKTPSKHNIVQHHVMNAISIRQVYYTPPQFHHFWFSP
jgi:hypothetical protein